MIRLIPASEFATSIPKFFDLLDQIAASTSERFGTDDLIWGLLQGKTQLWAWLEEDKPAVMAITEINQYPSRKAVNIIAAIGTDRQKWLSSSIEQIEQWAITMGATLMEVSARPGWQRTLKPYGYERKHITLEKPLGEVEAANRHADDPAVEASDSVSDDGARTG